MKRRWIGWPALTALGLLLALTLAPPPLTPEAWAQETDVGDAIGDAAAEVEQGVEATADAVGDAAEAAVAAVDPEVERMNAGIPEGLRKSYYYEAGDDGPVLMDSNQFRTNNLWVLIAAFLVFIMHLGFACVESGLTRAKNTVNILFKNTMIPIIGIVMFATCGWQIMYHSGAMEIIPGVLWFGFGIQGGGVYSGGTAEYITGKIGPGYFEGRYTVWTDFLFQGMFAATCATIVSGAVAERVKLGPFLLFTVLFVGILYPITGSWRWGGGWLWTDVGGGEHEIAGLGLPGFLDFAGSTLVHGVGGAGALAGALILGPRIGKYAKDGTVQPIPGHSMPLATIGVFLLWFGWFGFNGGSELSADPGGISYVCVTTTLAACGGGLGAAACTWIFGGKPDLSMTLNGILAGLVGITAGPDLPSWIGAVIICGIIPGCIVYFAVLFFDKIRIDDPVGAISVHGVCGIYGTLAVAFSGIFEGNASMSQLASQAVGTISCVLMAFLFAAVIFGIMKAAGILRVSQEEEIEGLDLGEHDMAAYPDFQQTYIKSYHAREI